MSYSSPIAVSTEGQNYLRYFSVDNAGNNQTIQSLLIKIDQTNPQVTSISSVASDTDEIYYDNTDDGSTMVIYEASADAIDCRWSETDLTYGAMVDQCDTTGSCDLDLSGEGVHAVFMRCRDTAGLTSSSSYNFDYTIDTIPPTITSITSVAGDTAAPFYDNTDDSSTQILFATSGDPTECKWSTSDQNYDSMPNTCTSVGNCIADLSGQGTKNIYLRCQDEPGNKMTSSYHLTYIIDSIVPNVLSIQSVAGDPQAPYVDVTSDLRAEIVYTASADAVQCKWSNNNVEFDSMTGTCSSTTSCIVTHHSDGLKTVYMRCRDNAGNKSTNSYQVDYEVDEVSSNGGVETDLETSTPGDNGNILVKFTLRGTTPVTNGSIKIRLQNDYDLSHLTPDDVHAAGGDVVWTNNEIINDNGVQVSSSQSSSWWIEKSYAAGEDSIIFPYIGSLDSSDGELSFTIGGLNQAINPTSTGSYSVVYNWYSDPNGTGDPVEDGDGLVYLNHLVVVTATVPSYLTFDILPVSDGTVNGASITQSTLSSSAVDFGTYYGADDRIAAHDLSVSTNATDGYIVTVEYDQTMSSSVDQIYPFTATNDNPLSWSSPSGAGIEGYFGYTTSDQSLYTPPYDRFANNKWAAFSALPQEVAYASSPVSNDTTRIGYRLDITNLQAAGQYNTTITYIAVPTF